MTQHTFSSIGEYLHTLSSRPEEGTFTLVLTQCGLGLTYYSIMTLILDDKFNYFKFSFYRGFIFIY